MNTLKPHLEILSESQLALWTELSDVPRDFVLYGGTALALRLGHRMSVDFDFFSNRGFAPDELERKILFLKKGERIQSSTDTLVSLVNRGDSVKVSFFGGLNMSRVADPDIVEGPNLLVASLLDIAATKIKVVQDRAEAKDYEDIARLLEEEINLTTSLAAAKAVYGKKFNPLLSLKALSYFGDGDLPALPEKVRLTLTSAVREVAPTALPVIKPLSGGLVNERLSGRQ